MNYKQKKIEEVYEELSKKILSNPLIEKENKLFKNLPLQPNDNMQPKCECEVDYTFICNKAEEFFYPETKEHCAVFDRAGFSQCLEHYKSKWLTIKESPCQKN